MRVFIALSLLFAVAICNINADPSNDWSDMDNRMGRARSDSDSSSSSSGSSGSDSDEHFSKPFVIEVSTPTTYHEFHNFKERFPQFASELFFPETKKPRPRFMVIRSCDTYVLE